ncbi:hypothetical protein L208DRAFT_1271251, partial [Tricholoma matsutake]
ILGIGKGILRVFSSDFPLLGAPPIPVICSIILTSDFPLLEAEVALIGSLQHPLPMPPAPALSKSTLCTKSHGLGWARPKPSCEWHLWLSPRFELAKAASGQAKAVAFGPIQAGTSLVVMYCTVQEAIQ